MKWIITDLVKESKRRGRHPSSNMALLSLSKFPGDFATNFKQINSQSGLI